MFSYNLHSLMLLHNQRHLGGDQLTSGSALFALELIDVGSESESFENLWRFESTDELEYPDDEMGDADDEDDDAVVMIDDDVDNGGRWWWWWYLDENGESLSCSWKLQQRILTYFARECILLLIT